MTTLSNSFNNGGTTTTTLGPTLAFTEISAPQSGAGASLTNRWGIIVNTAYIEVVDDNEYALARCTTALSSADHYSEVFIVGAGGAVDYARPGPAVRMATGTSGQCYVAYASKVDDKIYIGKISAGGTLTNLASVAATIAAAPTNVNKALRLTVSGTTTTHLVAAYNGVDVLTYDDSSSPITGNTSVGMFGYQNAAAGNGLQIGQFDAADSAPAKSFDLSPATTSSTGTLHVTATGTGTTWTGSNPFSISSGPASGLTNYVRNSATSAEFDITVTALTGVAIVIADSDSATTDSVATAGPPSKPIGANAYGGPLQATVHFLPPVSNNGGGAVGSYTAMASTGETQSGASSPLTITGLTTPCTITVTATNSAGTGAASDASNQVTPTRLLTRDTSGLILREDFSAANGWTTGSGFSRVAAPTLVTFGRLPSPILSPGGVGTATYDGIRECQIFKESDSLWYAVFDAGNGTTGWRQFVCSSTDEGLTWTTPATLIGLTNGAGGNHAAVATGWLEKRGSTYYLHRVLTETIFTAPNAGLPNAPYLGDTWTASDPLGTWTWVRNWGPGTGWASVELLPGSVYFDGTTYHMMVEGNDSVGQYQAGRQYSSSPGGPWTFDTTAQFSDSDFFSFAPENGKVFYHPFGKFVQAFNLIDPAGDHTSRNAIAVYSNIATAASPAIYHTQRKQTPNVDTNARAVGVQTHLTGPDGSLIHENGFVPFVFDTEPRATSPGWHSGRSIYMGVYEPATHYLSYSDATATRNRYPKTQSHTDFDLSFNVRWPVSFDGGDVSFEYRTNGTTGYRLRARSDDAAPYLRLEKMDGTSIQDASSGVALVPGMMTTIRIQVVGNQHKAWADDDLQIDVPDSTYASGTQVAISAVNCTAEMRLLTVMTSDTITINGLAPSSDVTLRAAGGLPVATVTANGAGVATYAASHYPMSRVDENQTSDMLLWGGDEVTIESVGVDLTTASFAMTAQSLTTSFAQSVTLSTASFRMRGQRLTFPTIVIATDTGIMRPVMRSITRGVMEPV